MGSVKLKETSSVGEAYSSIEYEFSDSVDFLAWESDKQERLTNALKGLYGGLDPEEYDAMTGEVKVTKKETKH